MRLDILSTMDTKPTEWDTERWCFDGWYTSNEEILDIAEYIQTLPTVSFLEIVLGKFDTYGILYRSKIDHGMDHG